MMKNDKFYLILTIFANILLALPALSATKVEFATKVLTLEKERYSEIISVGIKNQTEKIIVTEGPIFSCIERSLKENSTILLVMDPKTQRITQCNDL